MAVTTIIGKVVWIGEYKDISENFGKKEFAVEFVNEISHKKQCCLFTCFTMLAPKLDRFRVGQQVEVEYEIAGNRYQKPDGEVRYFNTLQVTNLRRPRVSA